MALKLNLKKSTFPVEIGEFKFEVDLSDHKAKKLEKSMTAFLKEVKGLSENPDDQDRFEELLKGLFDELLGKGAYKKLYNHTKRVDLLADLLGELIQRLASKLPGYDLLTKPLLQSQLSKAKE